MIRTTILVLVLGLSTTFVATAPAAADCIGWGWNGGQNCWGVNMSGDGTCVGAYDPNNGCTGGRVPPITLCEKVCATLLA